MGSGFGDIFFTNLVRRISECIGARYVYIGERIPGPPDQIRSRVFWCDGRNSPNFEYATVGTPCEITLQSELCWYSENMRSRFPHSQLLRDMDVESYIGVPLLSSRLEPIGLLVLMHDKPMPDDESLRRLFRLCASRAGAEMERMRIEHELRTSEERLRACVQSSPDLAVQWYDEEGRVRFWNRASEELYGMSSADMLGRVPGSQIMSEETLRRFMETLGQVSISGESMGPTEFQVRRRDGTLGYVESTFFPIPGEGGGRWFACMSVDITARRRAEDELRKSEAQYRHLIESSPLAMLVADLNHNILFSNDKFTELFGYSVEELRSLEGLRDLVYPDPVYRRQVQAEWDDRLHLAYISGLTLEPMDVEVVCKDGMKRHVQEIASLSGGRLLIVYTDITDRVRLELELRQAQKLELVGQLAGGVAHDFNNIIQAILGFIGLAQDSSLPEADREGFLKESMSAAKRASQLTRQLLAFGRRQPLTFQDTRLDELVSNLHKLLRRLIGEHIDVSLRIPQNLGLVRCDRTQMEQVLINLCVNSRDAMPTGGRITIALENKHLTAAFKRHHSWARIGHYTVLTVSDTGCGMDRTTQERVFEPFFTTKSKDQGTGLGLSVVYGIVRQHDGLIQLESEPGVGTTFRIYLPTIEEKQERAGNDPAAAPVSGGSELILLAEDDETIRNLVRRILMRAGYSVLCASNGEEAVSLYLSRAAYIDLLLFDVVMPKTGGLEAYDRIARKAGHAIPVIFASGYNDAFTEDSFQLPERCVLLQKPYDPDELLRQIRLLLGAKAANSDVETGM